MRHAKKFAVSLVFTSLLYNNCSSFKPIDPTSAPNLSANIDVPPPPTPQGVDPKPTATPKPLGTPVPKHARTVNPLPVVKQAELPKIASNFNINEWIGDPNDENPKNSYGPLDQVGAFRFICKPSHNLYDDPIVYPGQPGASHLHTFFGNTLANAHSTYESLRKTGDGTCSGGPLNRSGYWMPSLRLDDGDGNFDNDNVVMPDHLIVYYKMNPEDAQLFARGMRFIFGYNMHDPSKSTGFKWQCYANKDGVGGVPGDFNNLKELADAGCPAGSHIKVGLTAPHCWNGQLDSADHRSHLADVYYDNGIARCPNTHPLVFPSFSFGAVWTVGPEGAAEVRKMYLSSDKMHNSIPGSTMHTDWFGAWDDDVMAEWMNHAIASLRNCSAGVFGNGRGMADPFWKNKTDQYNSLLDLANPRVVAPPSR